MSFSRVLDAQQKSCSNLSSDLRQDLCAANGVNVASVSLQYPQRHNFAALVCNGVLSGSHLSLPSRRELPCGNLAKPAGPSLTLSEKSDFDDIDALRRSPLSSKRPSSTPKRIIPTLLEREALALDRFSFQEKEQATNCLVGLLEEKGVPSAYAFEFARHAGGLLSSLIQDLRSEKVHADECVCLEEPGDAALPDLHFLFDEKAKENVVLLDRNAPKTIEGHVIDAKAQERKNAESLASKLSACAERRSFPRLVLYFHHLKMKASDIPKVMPFIQSGIEAVMAKVEFLRSIGVKADFLAAVLVSWPKLLLYHCDDLAHPVEYLSSIGFTYKDIGNIVMKAPQILSQNVEELAKRVKFLEYIGMLVKDVRKVVGRYPSLFTDDYETKLRPLVSYLEGIGVRSTNIGKIIARRSILLESNFEKDLAPTIAYLRSINASPSDIDKILFLFPGLFGYDPEEDIRPVATYLEKLGVPPRLMGRLFRRHPQLLKNRFHIQQRIEYLLSLGVDPKDLGKVLFKAPQLMSLSVEENMVPTVKFLAGVGVNVVKVLKSKPMILGHSVEAKMLPNLKFLENLGINSDDIGKMVSRNPHLLTLSIEKNLQPTVSYLLDLGFKRSDIAEMVRKLPSLLGFSVATLVVPKYEFFVGVMKRSPKELVQFPHYFSYSLGKRLIPRFERLGEHFQEHCLGSVYSCSDIAFEKRFARWTSKADSTVSNTSNSVSEA